jgi:tRNA modification GTPase
LAARSPGRIVFGHWQHAQGEEVVVARLDDGSFELHVHGGHVASETVLDDLVAAGARRGTWKEWVAIQTTDPIRREAQLALADAQTERTAHVLLDQWHGALRSELDSISKALDRRNLDLAIERVNQLLQRWPLGRHLTVPWRVAIVGRANVGKSSLINAMVGYQRAIVFHQPGTTRDVVTATTAINGWPVVLADTAGLRDARDPLEAAGIQQAKRQIVEADLRLLVFDRSVAWCDADRQLLDRWQDSLVIHNKSDLPPRDRNRPDGLHTSATQGTGIEVVLGRIAECLVGQPPPEGAAVPFTEAQAAQLRLAAQALAARDMPTAKAVLSSAEFVASATPMGQPIADG